MNVASLMCIYNDVVPYLVNPRSGGFCLAGGKQSLVLPQAILRGNTPNGSHYLLSGCVVVVGALFVYFFE